MPDPSDPTTAEWVAAAVAAGLVVVVGALHLLRPVLRRSPAAAGGRVAGCFLTALAVGMLLVAGVALTAAALVEDPDPEVAASAELPDGPFATALVHDDADQARRVAGYTAAVLLPGAGVLGVLGLGVVAVGRAPGFRAVAGAVCGAVLGAAWLTADGDTGTPVHGLAIAALVLAAGAAAGLVVDEVTARRRAGLDDHRADA